MEDENKEGGYEIGYGKPPRSTRFQKGQSGNSRGVRKARRTSPRWLKRRFANQS